MKKGKFIQLLRTLDKKETKEFTNYLNGLYGTQLQMIATYHYIKSYNNNDYNSPKLNKSYAFENHFKKKGIALKVLTNHLSKLYRYLQEFLLWQKMKKERYHPPIQKMRLEILKERQLNRQFYTEVKKAIKHYSQHQSSWKHLTLLELHELNTYNSDGNQYTIKENRVRTTMESLDRFYAIFKLKYAVELLNRNNILNETNIIWQLESTVLYAKKNKGKEQNYLDLYYQLVQLIKTEEWTVFLRLESYLYQFDFEDKKEGLMLLTFLVNYLLKAHRNGRLDYAEKALELYQFGLKQKLMFANTVFPPIPFKNIVGLACILEKYTWARQFIETWAAEWRILILPDTKISEIKK